MCIATFVHLPHYHPNTSERLITKKADRRSLFIPLLLGQQKSARHHGHSMWYYPLSAIPVSRPNTVTIPEL